MQGEHLGLLETGFLARRLGVEMSSKTRGRRTSSRPPAPIRAWCSRELRCRRSRTGGTGPVPERVDAKWLGGVQFEAESQSGKDGTRQLRKAYLAKDAAETSGVYDDWAAAYETDMKDVGYAHPALVAAMLSRHLEPGGGEILDAGAGTGIMGEILAALGYANLVGLDASDGMLARAAAKGKYRELKHLYLGRPLDFADDRFAAVVSAGVFTR